MKSHKANLVIVDGCGDELLDVVMATVNYELSGDGAVLVHTDDMGQSNDTNGQVEKILEYLDNSPDSCTTSKHYEGLILLRR